VTLSRSVGQLQVEIWRTFTLSNAKTSSAVAEMGDRDHNRHGLKEGGAVPLSRSAGNPSNNLTMWPMRRSTSVPTLFPPRMSVTITFLTYSSHTSQSIAVATTAPVYLFIARQSRDRMSGVTHQNLIGYISAISKPIHFWFSPKLSAVQGLQS